jgi:hypothetical protein
MIEVFGQNHTRDPVKVYKSARKTKRQNASCTLPTIMRLIVLTLFIALPAAAYAAVFPRMEIEPRLANCDYSDRCVDGVGLPCCD